MSPERLDPRMFDLSDARPTVPSDCYALGMVVYEVISGNVPFYECSGITVFIKVMGVSIPSRGVGVPGASVEDDGILLGISTE